MYIWKDQWLHDRSHFLVYQPSAQLLTDSYITDLICHDTGQWNTNLISQLFSLYDARAIIHTPQVTIGFPLLPATTTGHFLFQIIYHYAMSVSDML